MRTKRSTVEKLGVGVSKDFVSHMGTPTFDLEWRVQYDSFCTMIYSAVVGSRNYTVQEIINYWWDQAGCGTFPEGGVQLAEAVQKICAGLLKEGQKVKQNFRLKFLSDSRTSKQIIHFLQEDEMAKVTKVSSKAKAPKSDVDYDKCAELIEKHLLAHKLTDEEMVEKINDAVGEEVCTVKMIEKDRKWINKNTDASPKYKKFKDAPLTAVGVDLPEPEEQEPAVSPTKAKRSIKPAEESTFSAPARMPRKPR